MLISIASWSQTDYNKWSIGFGIGGHDGMWPTSQLTRLYQIHHIDVNGRYMFNNRVGIMLDGGYDFFDYYGGGTKNSNYTRLSLQGVVNLTDLFQMHTFTQRWGILAHGGAGLSMMWNKDYFSENADDPFIKNSDDMLNFVLGITPQFKLNDKMTLKADLSFIGHGKQDKSFDFLEKVTAPGFNGYFMNVSVGMNFYLGKNDRHADWVPTQHNFEELEKRVLQLEENAKDDDQDGVPNFRDEEAGTPVGSLVNSKGVSLKDTDKDGIADEIDPCPTEAGTFATNGCPDSDNDGVSDKEDVCPDKAGDKSNKGCPDVTLETQQIINDALKTIEFEFGTSQLTSESAKAIDEMVKVLNAHPWYKLQIEGHADEVGPEDFNVLLSENRAKSVANAMIAKGIPQERVTTKAFGESKPKVPNTTPEGRSANRRVELKILF